MKKIKCPYCGKRSDTTDKCSNCGKKLFRQDIRQPKSVKNMPLLAVSLILIYVGINQQFYIKIFFIILAFIIIIYVIHDIIKSFEL